MNKRHKDLNEYLIKKLQDPKFALSYLNEALADEDQRVFLLALKNVYEAQGGDITTLAKSTNLNRQNLYRLLSAKGNPRWESLRSVLHTLNLELEIKHIKK